MQKERLNREEFERILSTKHGGEVYAKVWGNYPNSIFYYDRADFDGTTDNIGIYTSESIYSLEKA